MIILLTLSTLGYVSFRIYSEDMLKRAVENSFSVMMLINNNLDHLIQNMESQARLISINQNIQEEMKRFNDDPFKSLDIIPDDVTRAYYDILISNPMSMSTSLLTSQNRILYFGDIEDSSVSNIIDNEIINRTRDKIKPQWMGPVKVVLTNETTQDVFVIVKSIIDRDSGKFLGTVFVYVNETHISDIYQNENSIRNSRYHIIDNEGIVISSNNKEELYKPYSMISGGLEAVDIMKSNNYEIISDEGIESLQNTFYYEKLDWRIIYTLPVDEIQLNNAYVTQILFIVGIICSLLGIALSAIISKSITKPIYILSDRMKKVGSGELSIRVNEEEIKGRELRRLSKGFNMLMDDIQGLMDDVKKEQDKQHDYEFRLIQSQIKPHFLYNTIETIISCVKLDLKDKALMVSKSLALFYRRSLSSGKDIITIGEEVEMTRNYLIIQGFRYSEYLTYDFDVNDDIQNCAIQKLMLQPIVENAIYHGIKPMNQKGELKIEGRRKGDHILLTVRDNGVGMDKDAISKILSEEPEQREGFGLGSMNNRIKLLYGDEYGLEIESAPGEYTLVSLRIPLIERSDKRSGGR